MNLDTISFVSTASAAVGTVATPVTGDVGVIRNAADNSLVLLIAMWSKNQAGVFSQAFWPSGHDLVRGVRYRNTANNPENKLVLGAPGRFRPQDPLTVTQAGAATAGDVDITQMLLYYQDIPGLDSQLIRPSECKRRGVNILTYEDTCTPTVATTYSGQRSIDTASNLYQANTQYAILGATIGVVCGGLSVRGADTGFLRCTVPGHAVNSTATSAWFYDLAVRLDLPCIPTFNTANRAAVLLDIMQDENLAAVPFSLNMLELAPTSGAAGPVPRS